MANSEQSFAAQLDQLGLDESQQLAGQEFIHEDVAHTDSSGALLVASQPSVGLAASGAASLRTAALSQGSCSGALDVASECLGGNDPDAESAVLECPSGADSDADKDCLDSSWQVGLNCGPHLNAQASTTMQSQVLIVNLVTNLDSFSHKELNGIISKLGRHERSHNPHESLRVRAAALLLGISPATVAQVYRDVVGNNFMPVQLGRYLT